MMMVLQAMIVHIFMGYTDISLKIWVSMNIHFNPHFLHQMRRLGRESGHPKFSEILDR